MTSNIKPSDPRFSPSQILGIDIFADKVRFHKFQKDDLLHERVARAPFPILAQLPSKNTGHTCCLQADAGTALSVYFQCDKEHEFASDPRALIIFGLTRDPFAVSAKGETNVLSASLRALEILAHQTRGIILIRTRSPLILLGTPFLKNLASRLQVTLAVEFLETPSRQLLHSLPMPSRNLLQEMVPIARSLSSLGIAVELQLTPMVEKQKRAGWTKSAAAILKDEDIPTKLLPIHSLLPERYRHRADTLLLNDAHRLLYNELQLLVDETEELKENAA